MSKIKDVVIDAMNLKEEARQLYNKDVLVKEWQESFAKKLETHTVIDKRGAGFYCHCGRFSKEMAFAQRNQAICPNSVSNEIWIVHRHYDGCDGWD